jgi:hypothetical protein
MAGPATVDKTAWTEFTGTEYYVWPRWSLVGTNWQWTASGSGTDEWYLENNGGGAPTHGDTGVALTDPPMVEEGGSDMTQGTVGSLAVGQFDWGDNDTLGFNTLYVRLTATGDPDSQSKDHVKAGGNNTGAGTSEAIAWETIKYAVETGITRNATTGDRVNVKSGDADAYTTSGANVDTSLYATNGTLDAPLIISGYDTTPNDGGIARISLSSAAAYILNTTFDYNYHSHIRIDGNRSDYLVQMDQYCHWYKSAVINSGSSSSGTIDSDNNSLHMECYLEGESTTMIAGSTGTSARWRRCKGVNRGTGSVFKGACNNCLAVVEGNQAAGDYFFNGSATQCVGVCLGTPSATSRGIQLNSPGTSCRSNHVENVGVAIYVVSGDDRTEIYNNTGYNFTTASNYNSTEPAYAEVIITVDGPYFKDAAGGDFTTRLVPGRPDQTIATGGYVDSYGTDERYQTVINTGTGHKARDFVMNSIRRTM